MTFPRCGGSLCSVRAEPAGAYPLPGRLLAVGHSYGGAIALKAALMHPRRFAGLCLPGLGHMGPVTHPDPVNVEIERFLQEVAR